MTIRALLLATVVLAASSVTVWAQTSSDVIAAPVLRANVIVVNDIVRVGDLVDNAGTSAQIAIYRSPDLGTTGSLQVAQVIAALQAHQVIGVDTRDIKSVSVTRLSRTVDTKEIESQVARALEHRSGLGDAANLSLTFDRDTGDMRLDASNTGALLPVAVRYEPRSGRFDVSMEIANETNKAPVKLRYTGIVIETVEAAVLTRAVERNEVLKPGDVITERRPKAEVGSDIASRERAVGMQLRKAIRAGQTVKVADLAKPDLVQRDENVTLIYETAGLYLTIRGKAIEGGAEGDVINVLNLQSKRTVSGVVIGRSQVAITVAAPRLPPATDTNLTTGSVETSAPVSVAASNNSPVAAKPE